MTPELTADHIDLKTTTLFSSVQDDAHPNEISALFAESVYPWEILPKIRPALESLVANIPLHERIKGNVSDKACINSEMVVIEEGATVEAFCLIEGPTYISRSAVVRHGAYLRGGVYLGPKCVAGHTTEVKDSLLMFDSKAAHFAYIGNSILGKQVNLGAGTKLANMRLDHKQIRLRHGSHYIETNLKKFGAIFSDYSQSGCNSVTNPGTILLNYSAVLPTKNASGIVANKLGLVK